MTKSEAITVYCEYLINPFGLDTLSPRLSWTRSSAEPEDRQQSYRIRVTHHDTLCWDSGLVASAKSTNITYAGDPLTSCATYSFTVEVVTEAGKTITSAPQQFTMALLPGTPWQGSWIGGPAVEKHAFWYRKEFDLPAAPVKAMAFVASPNYHVFSFNGKKIGDAVLNAVWTDCDKTIMYSIYDICGNIGSGQNCIGLTTGNGWHSLRLSEDNVGAGENLFSLQIYFQFADGKEQWLFSSPDGWLFTNDGPILYNGIYNGETYDARLEMPGWDTCDGFDLLPPRVRWAGVVEREPLGGTFKAQTLEPIKVVDHIRPVAIHEVGDGSYGVDFGQNFAGWVKLRVSGSAGDEIVMKFAELEHADHSVNQANLRSAKATDKYILNGEGEEEYEPSFTYHGFRYMQVFGLKHKPTSDMFTGCVVRSAVDRIGDFSCDNAIINQLYKNILWTEASNLHGVPTDCPQRDERLGWLNDMTVRNECALYNYRLPQLYGKWLGDVRDTQGEKTGAITDTAPFKRYGLRPADPVSSAFLLVPWNVYLHYGDKRILAENYEANKRWVEYLRRNSDNYIVKYSQMGDWAGPIFGTDHSSIGAGAVSAITPTRFIGTCYFYYDCLLLQKMATVLGHDEDFATYTAMAEKIRQALLDNYYDPRRKCFASNSQASNTLPLYLGIEDPADRKAILDNLVSDITETNRTHLTTGNLCTRYIIEVLLMHGYEDLAFTLLSQTEYPSWGYMIENGATTIWERWEHITDGPLLYMASHNHPMNGAVGVAFHKHLAGIQPDEAKPGFENIVFKPVVPAGMRKVDATVESIRGGIGSSWRVLDNGSFIHTVTIPSGSSGTVHVPGKFAGAAEKAIFVDDQPWSSDRSIGIDLSSGIHTIRVGDLP